MGASGVIGWKREIGPAGRLCRAATERPAEVGPADRWVAGLHGVVAQVGVTKVVGESGRWGPRLMGGADRSLASGPDQGPGQGPGQGRGLALAQGRAQSRVRSVGRGVRLEWLDACELRRLWRA